MEKIKTGLAAFGMSGQIFHAPFISTNPAFCLTAITERNKNLSKERYPSARIVRSFEELVALDELELVVINTPDSTHYEYTRKALEAGKNVIVEKPFTATAEQGQELVDLARSKGLAISVYQNRRWDSDFLTVREILNKGLLGRLVEFESTFPRYRNFIKPGTWKETGELGGGLTYNLGAHVIDQAVQLFGVPEAVFADIDIILYANQNILGSEKKVFGKSTIIGVRRCKIEIRVPFAAVSTANGNNIKHTVHTAYRDCSFCKSVRAGMRNIVIRFIKVTLFHDRKSCDGKHLRKIIGGLCA